MAQKARTVRARINDTIYYFTLAEGDSMVYAWTATSGTVGYRVERFNGGKFGREWVRQCATGEVTF